MGTDTSAGLLCASHVFQKLTRDESKAFDRLSCGQVTVKPGLPVLVEGSDTPVLFSVLDGMGERCTMAGGRRRTSSCRAISSDFRRT
jgi:hypothetical protein